MSYSRATKQRAYVWGRALTPHTQLYCPTLLSVSCSKEDGHCEEEEIVQVASSMAARDGHRLAISQAGTLYAWGLSTDAQLGVTNFTGDFLLKPTEVDIPGKVVHVACGGYHTFAVTANGALFGWGRATHGLTAVESFDDLPRARKYPEMAVQVTPAPVTALDKYCIVQVACGFFHSLAVTDQGQVFSWGVARYGRLGLDSVDKLPTFEGLAYQAMPQPIKELHGKVVSQVACGSYHSLALVCSPQIEVYSWGKASVGRLGLLNARSLPLDDQEPYQPIPAPISVPAGCLVAQIASGWDHNMLVTSVGEVYAWGSARCGSLGLDLGVLQHDKDGVVYKGVPTRVESLRGRKIKQVAYVTPHSRRSVMMRRLIDKTHTLP